MEIRKGPYGHYAIEKIGNTHNICYYSHEIISENILGHMLPVYINPSIEGYELYFDYSGLSQLKDRKPSNLDEKNKLRECLGDLLLTFSLLPDYLLSPMSVTLDENYIFVDNSFKSLYVCYNPSKIKPEKLNLSSLLDAGIRNLLESDIFKEIILPEETDKIIYSLQTEDEKLFIQGANNIRTPLEEEKKENPLLKQFDFQRCLAAGILSLGFTLLHYPLPSIILVFISLLLGIKTYLQICVFKNDSNSKEQDDSKTKILFGSNQGNVLSCLILTSEDINGDKISKAIYTDKATIGSDRFLCDIFIDDESISPIHAEIKKTEKSYFICDISSDNSTFLDNVRLEPQKDYEVKSGQTLICSQKEFQIEIN